MIIFTKSLVYTKHFSTVKNAFITIICILLQNNISFIGISNFIKNGIMNLYKQILSNLS